MLMTPYNVGKNHCNLEIKLQKASVKLFEWFYENGMQTNQEKVNLSCLDISAKFLLPACILEHSGSQKILGVTIDRKLNFNDHVTNLCDKTSRKIQTFAKIFPYIPQIQKRYLKNVFIFLFKKH